MQRRINKTQINLDAREIREEMGTEKGTGRCCPIWLRGMGSKGKENVTYNSMVPFKYIVSSHAINRNR